MNPAAIKSGDVIRMRGKDGEWVTFTVRDVTPELDERGVPTGTVTITPQDISPEPSTPTT